jgi:hypothetical protein
METGVEGRWSFAAARTCRMVLMRTALNENGF